MGHTARCTAFIACVIIITIAYTQRRTLPVLVYRLKKTDIRIGLVSRLLLSVPFISFRPPRSRYRATNCVAASTRPIQRRNWISALMRSAVEFRCRCQPRLVIIPIKCRSRRLYPELPPFRSRLERELNNEELAIALVLQPRILNKKRLKVDRMLDLLSLRNTSAVTKEFDLSEITIVESMVNGS